MKEKWRKWGQELENYLLATEKDERADKIKIAILLNLLGSEGLEIFNTFKFEPPLSQKNYSEVLKKFEEYCSLRQNVVYERYKFFSCVQQEGQAIECYVTQLKTLTPTCEFEEQENVLIRDRIVLGIRDSGLKERLLRESGLGLEKAIEIVRTAETSREQLRSMKEETVATVNSVKRNRRQNQGNSRHKSTSAKSVNSKNIHEMKVPENELDIYIDSVTKKVQENELNSDSMNKNVEIVSGAWYKSVTLNVNKYFEVDFKLDTGAEVNILPLYVLNIVKVKPKLSETYLSLTAYGNFKLKPEGTAEFPDEPYHITLKDDAIPVIHPPRRVPQTLQPKLKETLDKLEKEKNVSKKRNQKLFGDIEGVEIYFDDIIVAGNDETSHDAIMSNVLERARSVNIKFNPDKLQYRVSEVKYVGQIISKSGIKPDPDHIQAIVEMPTPKSKTEVRRLLGMINFLSKFIPNLSKVTATLREIIHENVEFNWGKEQEMSFENIKELLTKTPISKVFSANDEIVIQCDSSKDGLGSCLIQKGQPVPFVSRSLTKSEKNYAQIEKELLAIVFFHLRNIIILYMDVKCLYKVTIDP
ncbi:Retrovirus-related Pol polyprotein from transposon 17.6 [Araneus ventricosus]|uniref:Retrovirus-related Pol polyprotein from transposon 17.6 n=1 Tax=Araneus ventricosus TaxID=182803 RepID=A0A4Y2PVX4_ARAVE|nr:Retrovirus-related Pol polyprotein from transposon 17.6 [Araneus ventricosus]